jgi:hypothetical protein
VGCSRHRDALEGPASSCCPGGAPGAGCSRRGSRRVHMACSRRSTMRLLSAPYSKHPSHCDVHLAATPACPRVCLGRAQGPWESLAGQLATVSSCRAGSRPAGALVRACGLAVAGPWVENSDWDRLCRYAVSNSGRGLLGGGM